mmetsp:Transcript_104967/g.321568  ORF Transcript_104967/g.321568 Transcript_104967/m.321568 type:complete len:398 (-) Transcript_104967:7-1200(-)
MHQAWVRRQVRRLHLDLGGVRIRDVPEPRQRGIDLGREVRVVRDDVLLRRPGLAHLALLLHLSEHLGPVPLAPRQIAVALVLLPLAHALRLVRVGGLPVGVPLLERGAEELQALLLQLSDLLLPVGPVAKLLRFHELHPHLEAGLVGGRGQHLVEEPLLPRALDDLEFGLRGRQPLGEREVRQGQHLGHLVRGDVIIWRVRVRLRLGLAVHALRAHGLRRRLRGGHGAIRNLLLAATLHGVHDDVGQRGEHLLVRPSEELVAVLAVHLVGVARHGLGLRGHPAGVHVVRQVLRLLDLYGVPRVVRQFRKHVLVVGNPLDLPRAEHGLARLPVVVIVVRGAVTRVVQVVVRPVGLQGVRHHLAPLPPGRLARPCRRGGYAWEGPSARGGGALQPKQAA